MKKKTAISTLVILLSFSTASARSPASLDTTCRRDIPGVEDFSRDLEKIFGKADSGSVCFGGILEEPIKLNNNIEYTASLYIEVMKLWLQSKDRGFVVFKQEDGKIEYAGGTLIPIASKGDIELAGNYLQFVDDFNIEKLVLYEDSKLASRCRLVNISEVESEPSVKRVNYRGTNFYINEIIKDESTNKPTNVFCT